jgi:hypothetical protein
MYVYARWNATGGDRSTAQQAGWLLPARGSARVAVARAAGAEGRARRSRHQLD